MNTYTVFFWKTGKSELIEGDDFYSAFEKAGHGRMNALSVDFRADGDKREKYFWSKERGEWLLDPKWQEN